MGRSLEVSFEFFPPSSDARAVEAWRAILRLAVFNPRFVSVTYGADGSLRSKTRDWVLRIARETKLNVAPHLTCVAESREALIDLAQEYGRHGLKHVVALRGDPPGAAAGGLPPGAGGGVRFRYASELVGALARLGVAEISVAAFPEGHPESAGVEADIANLKRKQTEGATRAITQFCFDTDAIVRYRDRCSAAGIALPIVPGILPILDFEQMRRFARRCGARVPPWLSARFEDLDPSPAARRRVSAEVALDQVEALRRHGFEAVHFYTLNTAELTSEVCRAAGLSAAPEAAPGHTGSSSERASAVKSLGPVSLMCQQSSSRTPNSPGM